MYFFWALLILLWIVTIYYFVIREKVFSPMTSKKWTIVCCTVVFGLVFFMFLDFCGRHQSWLFQESLSNLKEKEGILKLTHYTKGNFYYLQMKNGEKLHLKFVYPSMSRFEKYEGEYVTIWEKSGRYVYQMELNGDVVFSIDEANEEVFLYNFRGSILNLGWLWVIAFIMFMSMCTKTVSKKRIKK